MRTQPRTASIGTALLTIALAIGASPIGGARPQEAPSPVAPGARVIPNPGLGPASDWPARFEAWLRLHGWLQPAPATPTEPGTIVWTLDRLDQVGGHAATVFGAPRLVETDIGPAVEFDGAADGLQLDVNPIAGLERFTVEVLFQPAAGGPEEQRFLHFEEAATGNRALLETRMLPGDTWCLDTFLRYGDASLTLIDRGAAHTTDRWHVAALSFDGRVMAHYVDGARQAAGEVAFKPLGEGRTSIGVRLNQVSWFKGRIRQVRITPRALAPDELLRVPG